MACIHTYPLFQEFLEALDSSFSRLVALMMQQATGTRPKSMEPVLDHLCLEEDGLSGNGDLHANSVLDRVEVF